MAASGGSGGKRQYSKENTVVLDVLDNKSVKAARVIDGITELCGEGSVFACVPKSGNLFEVTLEGRAGINILLDGVLIDGKRYDCHDITKKFTLVSFLHLPAYIDDDEIKEKLETLGVELVSPIKRRFYKGTNVADGTRYARVKLPANLKSLPYTMKFGKDYHRVIHDNQLKVCSLCYSDEHLFKECPQFVCFTCGGQGHFRKACKTQPCVRCGDIKYACDCARAVRCVDTLCDRCGSYDCRCFDTGAKQDDSEYVCVVESTEGCSEEHHADDDRSQAVSDESDEVDNDNDTDVVSEEADTVSGDDDLKDSSEVRGDEAMSDDVDDNVDIDGEKCAGGIEGQNVSDQSTFGASLLYGDVFPLQSAIAKPSGTKFWDDEGTEEGTEEERDEEVLLTGKLGAGKQRDFLKNKVGDTGVKKKRKRKTKKVKDVS